MYLPRAFEDGDMATLDALMAGEAFVTLVTTDAQGLPVASHLPVLYRREGDKVLVEGHWARANPQARHAGPALLVAQGPHGYISPAWYPDKEAAARVPTWNYLVAHLAGRLETFEDPAGLADLVGRLSERHEARVGSDWRFEPERADHAAQLRGIVGFRLRPDRIQIKAKLNQNHPAANVRGAIEGLRAAGSPDDLALASLMEEHLARREHHEER